MGRGTWAIRKDAESVIRDVEIGSELHLMLKELHEAGRPFEEGGRLWRIDRAVTMRDEVHFFMTEAESYQE